MCSTVFTVATKCHTQVISLSNYLCMKRVYFYVLLLDVMVNMFISEHETYFFLSIFFILIFIFQIYVWLHILGSIFFLLQH